MARYTFKNVRIEGARVSPLVHVDANDFDVADLHFEDIVAPTRLANEGHLNVGAGNAIDGVQFTRVSLGSSTTGLADAHLSTQGAVTNVTFAP